MVLITCYIFGLVLLLAKIKLMSQVGDSDAIRRIIIEILSTSIPKFIHC